MCWVLKVIKDIYDGVVTCVRIVRGEKLLYESPICLAWQSLGF